MMIKGLWVSLILVASLSASSAAQLYPQRVRASGKFMETMIVKKVAPVYPPDAKKDHIQGAVELKVTVDKQGNVAKVQTISGPDRLVPSAIEAVKQWKYKPYSLNGNPVEVETKVTVNFTLAEESPAQGIAGDAPGGLPPGTIGSVRTWVQVPEALMRAQRTKMVDPTYPPLGIQARIQGTVSLTLEIDENGNVQNIRLISGHPILAPSAVWAAKDWKYKPYLKDGKPAAVVTSARLTYQISKENPSLGLVSEPEALALPTSADPSKPRRIRAAAER